MRRRSREKFLRALVLGIAFPRLMLWLCVSYLNPLAQLFEGRISIKPWLQFYPGFFLSRISILFRASNHKWLTKRIKLNFLFKFSFLNSNFALTTGYLTKHLNNLGPEKCRTFEKSHKGTTYVRDVASPHTCRPGPINFWFDHSTACNTSKLWVVGVS